MEEKVPVSGSHFSISAPYNLKLKDVYTESA